MKTFKNFLFTEVAQPVAAGEKKFADMHAVKITDYPVKTEKTPKVLTKKDQSPTKMKKDIEEEALMSLYNSLDEDNQNILLENFEKDSEKIVKFALSIYDTE